jgi:hypothetical protein
MPVEFAMCPRFCSRPSVELYVYGLQTVVRPRSEIPLTLVADWDSHLEVTPLRTEDGVNSSQQPELKTESR